MDVNEILAFGKRLIMLAIYSQTIGARVARMVLWRETKMFAGVTTAPRSTRPRSVALIHARFRTFEFSGHSELT